MTKAVSQLSAIGLASTQNRDREGAASYGLFRCA
jgi:hypothetical protein